MNFKIVSDNFDIRLVDTLNMAREEGASDIHWKVGIPPYVRVEGVYQPLEVFPPFGETQVDEIARSILPQDRYTEFRNTGDTDSSFRQQGEGPGLGRFRVHAYKDRNGSAVSLRVIPNIIRPVNKLGFWNPRVYNQIIDLDRGLVLVVGSTGSGKTTTVFSLLDAINHAHAKHIITVEDPVEYELQFSNSFSSQREVGSDTQSFHTALKGALRSAPDVLSVGEIRDRDSALIALTAAESGHVVFATLHANNTWSAAQRLVSIVGADLEEYVRNAIASCGTFFIAQKLIPYQQVRGRTLIMEVMNIQGHTGVREHIRKGDDKMLLSELQTGWKKGMHTMDQHIKHHYDQGHLTPMDVYKNALDPRTILSEEEITQIERQLTLA